MQPIRLVLTLLLVACFKPAPLTNPSHAKFAGAAPDSFDVEMRTTKGMFLVRVHRQWAPNGADRFYALVRNRYFDSVAFHRTIRNFVAQFGIHGDTAVSAAWRGKNIADDSVRHPNSKGTLAFARGGPNTRSVQLYFNTVDNTPRLDTLNGFGFPPIGEVIYNREVLDSLNWEYSGTRGGQTFPGPAQDSISRQGNAYLRRLFPRLDYIVSARVARRWDNGSALPHVIPRAVFDQRHCPTTGATYASASPRSFAYHGCRCGDDGTSAGSSPGIPSSVGSRREAA